MEFPVRIKTGLLFLALIGRGTYPYRADIEEKSAMSFLVPTDLLHPVYVKVFPREAAVVYYC